MTDKNQGWISIHRKIRENWLFQEKRVFSKFEAWIDLLLQVNHQENNKVILGNELFSVREGETITSIRKLCKRWDWSNTKIINFLKILKKEGMIRYKSDTQKTIIFIENYSKYQSKEIEKTTQKRHDNDTITTQKHTNNKDNNDFNDNNSDSDATIFKKNVGESSFNEKIEIPLKEKNKDFLLEAEKTFNEDPSAFFLSLGVNTTQAEEMATEEEFLAIKENAILKALEKKEIENLPAYLWEIFKFWQQYGT